jgi:hypothetical protein
MVIDEGDGMIYGMVCVSVGRDVPIRRAAVTDDRCARLDPVTNNSHECFGGWNIRHST